MNIENITGNIKEYDSLTELADVTFENNRLVIRISDPIAARKFGLSDKTWRYEFDGSTMYWYKDKDETVSCDWQCSCGRGGYTLVSTDTEKQIRSVKDEMVKQIEAKKMRQFFGNKKEFTNVAIELNAYFYDKDESLVLRKAR